MKIVVAISAVLMSALPLMAQQISIDFGAQIGVPITRALPPSLQNQFSSTRTRPLVPRLASSPTVIVFVDDRLAVDVEALFRPVRYETDSTSPTISSFDRVHATALE